MATSSAPTAAMPVGPENSVSAPMMIAMATGSSRLVATPRSTEHQVSRMPSAIIGSGRSPLFSGSQNARNMPAAVHAAARLVFTAWPSRGMTSRLISHQHVERHHQRRQPHPDAVGADVRPQRQQVVVPAERRFGGAEPSVVVGHVAGVLGHPGHGQDVAVVGGVGADEVPPHQHGGHHPVERRHRPPPRRQEALTPSAVGGVQDVQGAEGDRPSSPRRRSSPASSAASASCCSGSRWSPRTAGPAGRARPGR